MRDSTAERAEILYYNFIKAATQLPARPLTQFYEAWQSNCVLTDWLDRTLRLGYSLQFCGLPPAFRGIQEKNLSSQEEIDFLTGEIQELLLKQAVSIVPPHDRERGFYSPYFLVPKKTGDYRPILDLRALNMRIGRKTFRMLTTKKLLELVQPGDWFTTIDLKDPYFHVEVAPKHRKFLHFALAYEYNRLPFGYSLAPRTFSKCVDAALQPLRSQNMRVFFYLDNLIVMARSKEWAIFQPGQFIIIFESFAISDVFFASIWRRTQLMESVQPGPGGCTGGRRHIPAGGTLSVLLHSHMCPLCGSSIFSTVLCTSPAPPAVCLGSSRSATGGRVRWRGILLVLFLSPSILGLGC